MKKRKTIEVVVVRDKINEMIHLSRTQEERRALAILGESFLMSTGNYHGFQYLDWVNGGCSQWLADGQPSDKDPYLGDQTRIRFL